MEGTWSSNITVNDTGDYHDQDEFQDFLYIIPHDFNTTGYCKCNATYFWLLRENRVECTANDLSRLEEIHYWGVNELSIFGGDHLDRFYFDNTDAIVHAHAGIGSTLFFFGQHYHEPRDAIWSNMSAAEPYKPADFFDTTHISLGGWVSDGNNFPVVAYGSAEEV